MAGAGAGAVGFPWDLMVQRIQSLVEEGFWDALRRLKLDVLGTDDSPIPITGYYTPRQRRPMASFFNLRSGSLVPPSHNSVGDRNNCPVPGTLINTNNMRGFQNLDREQLLKAEAKKILLDIVSGKVEEDPSVLLRFLVTSFADLKNWKVYYNVAFPSLVFNSRMTLLNLQPASKVLTKEEAASMYTSLQKRRASSETTVIPFFLVSISSDSSASIRQLKDWKACQGNYQKLLFGFYDHGCRSDCPGWVIRNYVAFLSIRWKIEKVQFFCYREYKGNPDLEQSLIGEASFPSPCGINPGKRTKEMKPKEIDLQSMNPASQDEEKQLMHLKLMGWRHFPVNIEKLSHVRVLLLGAGTLGCEVARLLMTWGVRKLTVVDSNSVVMSDLVKQSLYIDKDCGVPRVAAIVPHLKDRCPAVEVEGIQMEIPVPGHPVSSSNVASVLDDCKHLQTLVAANDAVFLLTDTWESRWLPTLLCASENKIAISVVLGCDSYLVMRHGAGPGTSGGTDEVITQIENLSTEDALGHQRLGCCFCNDAASLINPIPYGTLPGLTSVASGKAVELFARMLHHPDEIHAPGDTARMETEHQLGLLPHQLRGSLPECVLSMELSNSLVNCTACSVAVLSEYRRRGLDFVMQAINYPTYLKDFTGISDLKRPDTCPKIPASISVNSDKISDVRCLLLGAGTLGCDVARILMDCGVRRLTVVDSGRVVVSNLARQSLYTSDDRGAPKATAILRHLVERCPSVDAQGVKMEIPMPGHPVSPGEAAGVLQDCERLKELVASHDAIFLLTDTRESRWLPTLLCTNENKIAITAALGYDSYLVMRHGAGPGISCEASNAATATDKLSTEDALGRQRLGCYFCNDVIAPVDSVSNRTLDQQCTVTRPGLASIASGRAADLFRRMLYHPDGIHAPGEIAGTGSSHEHGLLPHQMRGSLSQYNLLTLLGYSSSNCTACSNAVLSEYRRRGMDFVMQVINEPTYLEDLTGLTDLMKSTSYSQVEWVDDTDEDDFIEV
uniref:Ubiquitin-like modifier-activating enzyme ATG7 n=1 Tax=Saccharum hybrid cultivar SP80-3280 TaxID=193079 RepID=A0A2R4QNG7_9POAL|nr:ubiquitin-activating enzyme E1 [Saccharum hybrid cultivar SP80-3280]AVY91668.1 ubiquitin-activating enzyme E1-like-like protein [Saccharum hybrid cultivar SP80-3280]AVY91739.1 ubiquitin-activating [Saccharum hybrid cultivar SP80-3280]